jgi:hypothetical protein
MITNALHSHFDDIRNKNGNKAAPEIIFKSNYENQVIKEVLLYLTDSLSEIRSEAYYIVKKIGLNSKDSKIRQSSVETLIKGCKDKDGGISGLAGRYLTEFNKDDFDATALDELRKILSSNPSHYDNILKLTGYLQMKDMVPVIKDKIDKEKKIKKESEWAGHLALARMGEADELNYCLSMIKSVPVDDDVIYEMAPDLIYTRQKGAFEYLVTILNSNEQNCSSADPESSDNIECGYRVMELLAPVIVDYPLELEASGDIKTDDYPKALQTVREWFKNKKQDYIIKTGTY